MSNQIQALRHAVSRQRRMAGDLNGRVHSVFRHAVNFLMEDDCFVTLMLSGKPLCPEKLLCHLMPFKTDCRNASTVC